MPRSRSRTVPCDARSGPDRLAATRPPIVVRSGCGGSSGSHWPAVASCPWRLASGQPASTVTVMSAAWWSSVRCRRSRRRRMSSARGAPPTSRCAPRPDATRRAPERTTACTSPIPAGRTTQPGTTPSTWSPAVPPAANSAPTMVAQSITPPRAASGWAQPEHGATPRFGSERRHLCEVLLDGGPPGLPELRLLGAHELEHVAHAPRPAVVEREQHEAERRRHATAELLVRLGRIGDEDHAMVPADDQPVERRAVPEQATHPRPIGAPELDPGPWRAVPEEGAQHALVEREQLDVGGARRAAVDRTRAVTDQAEAHARGLESRDQSTVDHERVSSMRVYELFRGQATRSERRLPARRPRLHADLGVREHLVRIGPLLGIEDRAQSCHREQIVRSEEQRHLGDLLDPDPVLAGDAAAKRHARLQDLPASGEHPGHLVGSTLVEQDDGMDVAVAGVEDVADAEPVPLRRRGDGAQDVGDARARHHAVLRAVARREATDGPEGALAGLPECGALRVVACEPQLTRVPGAADHLHPCHLVVEAGGRSVELD